MLDCICPHCNTNSNFQFLTGVDSFWGQKAKRVPVRLQSWECENCTGIVIVMRTRQEYPASLIFMYPSESLMKQNNPIKK